MSSTSTCSSSPLRNQYSHCSRNTQNSPSGLSSRNRAHSFSSCRSGMTTLPLYTSSTAAAATAVGVSDCSSGKSSEEKLYKQKLDSTARHNIQVDTKSLRSSPQTNLFHSQQPVSSDSSKYDISPMEFGHREFYSHSQHTHGISSVSDASWSSKVNTNNPLTYSPPSDSSDVESPLDECEIFIKDATSTLSPSADAFRRKRSTSCASDSIIIDAAIQMLDSETDDSSPDELTICYKRLLLIPLLFLINLAIIMVFYIPLRSILGLGMLWNFQELKQTLTIIQENVDESGLTMYVPLMALYSSIYIFIQTFCIPGSIMLNCLAGAIFGTTAGIVLCTTLTAAGSAVVYWLCKWVGEEMVLFWFGTKLEPLNRNIEQMSVFQRFFYMLALRTFPLTPQYLLNVAAPIMGIEIWMFITSIVVGLLPFHFVTVRAGLVITKIHSSKDILQTETCLVLAFLSLLLITPPILKRTKILEKYFGISL